MHPVLLIARHELLVALKTRRIVIFATLYAVAAVVGGLAYIVSLRFLEQQATRLLVQSGADPITAAGTVTLATEKGYQQLVTWLAGVSDIGQVAAVIRESVILPAVLWGSLAFLPFLVVLVSFDHVAADLQSRSILYSVVRVSRHALLAGKLLAQTLLFAALCAVASGVLLPLAAAMLESFSVSAAALGLVRLWLLLLPYGLAYLALATLCSTLVRQPTVALVATLGSMIVLRGVGWLGQIPPSHTLSPLSHLAWLSPATYHDGLWLAGAAPLSSVAAYLGFAAVFISLAALRLSRRDL